MSEDSDTEKKRNPSGVSARLSNHKSDMSKSPLDVHVKPLRRARALFSYSPEQEDELKLEVDDVIDIVEEVEEGWWRGKIRGKTGVFPSNFVEVVETNHTGKVDKSDDESKGDAVVIQPKKQPQGFGFGNIFQGQPPIELRTTPKGGGDMTAKRRTVEAIVDKVEPAEAVVPEEKQENHKAAAKPKEEKPTEEYAKALFQYEADNNDELSLEVGDVVLVLKKECEDPGWWFGELNGRRGLFPDNFCKLIPPDDVVLKKPPHTPPAVPLKPKHFGSTVPPTSTTTTTPPVPSASGNNSASFLRSSTPEPHPQKLEFKPPSVLPSVPSDPVITTASTTKQPKLSQSPAPPVIPTTSTPPPPELKEVKKEAAAAEPASKERASIFGGGKKPIGGVPIFGGLAGKFPGLAPKMPDKSKEKGTEEPKSSEKSKDEKAEKEKDLDKLGGMDGPERLNHPTASRPKNPSKRPPSTVFLQSLGKDTNPAVADDKGPHKSPSSDSIDGKGKGNSAHSGEFVSRAEYERLKAEFEAFRIETAERLKVMEAKIVRF